MIDNTYSYGNKKCELLAPAGSKEAFIAAIEAGADAVYVGGSAFNARANATNFTIEELRKAVSFAHKRRVKVYVTVNILIKDEELLEALEYCRQLNNIGVDAIIVQDLGLGSLVREFLPELPIHMSTQGSVYNLEGVKAAAELGYERVVTARELSYDEIREICQNTDTEIEIFIHGAQCICYSGQCQLSRFNGGRSGNRGQCAQPCRLAYTGISEDGKGCNSKASEDTNEFAHLLSPSDLCLIDSLDKIIECGVASLKIEGRMKSPEYVAIVISIYRKYIDQYYETGKVQVEPKDKEALLQIFNRGNFTEAYFSGESDSDFMSKQVPKNRGIEIGKVIDPQSGRDIIEVKTTEPIKQGDGVEIRGKGYASNIATFIQQTSGSTYRIGDFKTKVYKGDTVFRTTSKEQIDYAGKFYKNKTWSEGKYAVKLPVDIYLNLEGGSLTATAVELDQGFENGFGGTISSQAVLSALEPAEETSNMCSRAIESFKKSGGTPFEVVNVYTDKGLENCEYKLTMSSMNKLRRKLLGRLEGQLERVNRKIVEKEWLENKIEEVLDNCNTDYVPWDMEIYCMTWDSYKRIKQEMLKRKMVERLALEGEVSLRYVVPAYECIQHIDEINEFVIPYITNISKGKEEEYLKSNLEKLKDIGNQNGIYAGNLGWIEILAGLGIDVYGDYGLNVYNEATEMVLSKMGVKSSVWSLEKEEESSKPIPVMVTEQPLPYKKLIDRKGLEIDIIKREYSDQRILIPSYNGDGINLVENAMRIKASKMSKRKDERDNALDQSKVTRVYI